jgi:hypothetical protein
MVRLFDQVMKMNLVIIGFHWKTRTSIILEELNLLMSKKALKNMKIKNFSSP